MKTKARLLIALLFLMLPALAPAIVSTADVLKRLVSLAALLEGKDYQLLMAQVDFVTRNGSSSMTYELAKGETYRIVAIGDDERVFDIDLRALDENDRLVGNDDDETNIAEVSITPKWTGKFRFEVSAHRMAKSINDAFYALVIARQAD